MPLLAAHDARLDGRVGQIRRDRRDEREHDERRKNERIRQQPHAEPDQQRKQQQCQQGLADVAEDQRHAVFQQRAQRQIDHCEHGEEIEAHAQRQQHHARGEARQQDKDLVDLHQIIIEDRAQNEQRHHRRDGRAAAEAFPEIAPEGLPVVRPQEVIFIAHHHRRDAVHRRERRRDRDDGHAREHEQEIQLQKLEKLPPEHVHIAHKAAFSDRAAFQIRPVLARLIPSSHCASSFRTGRHRLRSVCASNT